MNTNKISNTGFWISPNESNHAYVPDMQKIINSIIGREKPELIYDFGCGFGEYIKVINKDIGIECIGFEGMPDKRAYENIIQADLSLPLKLERKSDISISLEVGEHIPKEYEDIFIDNICNNTKDIAIFSWAVVGQGGEGHINCRDNEYIIKKMESRGFSFNPKILQIRKSGNLRWFKRSLMLFNRE